MLKLTWDSLGSLGRKDDRQHTAQDETKIPVKAMAAVDCRTPSRPGSKTSQTQGRSWLCFCHILTP